MMKFYEKFRGELIKEQRPLFSLPPLFALLPSFWGAMVIIGLFVLYFQMVRYGKTLTLLFFCESVLLYLIFLLKYRIVCRNILRGKNDFRKGNLKEINGYLMYSQSLSSKSKVSIPDMVLQIFYREQKAVYQKVFYSEGNDFSSEMFFYCVITDLKANALKALYRVDTKYRDIGVFPQSMKFLDGVPLKLVIGKESHVLKEIQPVSQYEYSKSQLLAIQDFNRTSFTERKSGKAKRVKDPGLGFAPFYLLWKSFLYVFLGNTVLFFLYSVLLFLLQEPIYGIGRTKYLFSLIGIFPLCYIGIAMTVKNFWYFLYGSDLNKSYTVKGHFVQAYTNGTQNGFGKNLARIFPDTNPAFYQIRFKIEGLHLANKKAITCNTLNMVLTTEKISALKNIYSLDVRRTWAFGNSDALGLDNVVEFHDDIPLTITYQEKSLILQSIAPAEDYDYTLEQLAAIERFNTLYP